MSTPIILLVGQSGSGKDTAAEFIAKNHNAAITAQADPMKRLVRDAFGFSDHQLWGPSSARNAFDTRFADDEFRWKISEWFTRGNALPWLRSVLPDASVSKLGAASIALSDWADGMCRRARAEGGLSARTVLQTLGTEWGRTHGHRNIWTDNGIRTAKSLLGGGFRYSRTEGLQADESERGFDYVVITDGRFRNELLQVTAVGGRVFHVKAPDATGSEAEKAGVQGHQSETEQRLIPAHWFDAVLLNDKRFGFAALEETVMEAMNFFSNSPPLFQPTELVLEQIEQQKKAGVL